MSKLFTVRPSGCGSTAPRGRTATANSNSTPKVRRFRFALGMPARGKSMLLKFELIEVEGKV
jgi:hypothetical protein